MRQRGFFSGLMLCLLAVGCAESGTGPAGPSWFRATLEGEVTGTFEGTGDFSFQRDYAETPYYFTIHAKGADPETDERFYIRWPITSRPGTGSHPLVPQEHEYGSASGATVLYWRIQGDDDPAPAQVELYVASGGVVEITRSTADVVEGSIRFSGVQVIRDAPSGPQRADPVYRPDPAAPRIEVEGSFRARYSEGFGSP
jgi:hypothetical protein